MQTPFPNFHNTLPIISEQNRWDELHLYSGSKCNRTCTFCCVNGEPKGTFANWTEETLQYALQLVAKQGSLKFYGGEPTLDTENLLWAIQRLRELGFCGTITIFSNGIRAHDLITLLCADDQILAVLNYAIATGTGEKPLPNASLKLLQQFATDSPNRIFVSHDFVVPVGRQSTHDSSTQNTSFQACFRCFPVLTSFGKLHACPFAVEENRPHYWLGDLKTEAKTALKQFENFLGWIDSEIEPLARAQNQNTCTKCVHF